MAKHQLCQDNPSSIALLLCFILLCSFPSLATCFKLLLDLWLFGVNLL